MKDIIQAVSAPVQLKPVSVSAVAAAVKPTKSGNPLPSAEQAAKKTTGRRSRFSS